MKGRFCLTLASIALIVTACTARSDNPVTPPADRANDSAPVDTTSARGPGMMGGGG